MNTTEKHTFAVLVPAFAQRAHGEPSPCNERLAAHTVRICGDLAQLGHTVVLVTQWEVDQVLRQTDGKQALLHKNVVYAEPVLPNEHGDYLVTRDVYYAARQEFSKYNPTYFVAIAQPFIHRLYVNMLAGKDFTVRSCCGIRVGFDPKSTQWWCRSWWQLLAYTILTGLGMKRGHAGRQLHT